MDASSSWQWMSLMALLLGVRHGFDLDHLATIDAITRTTSHNRILSKMVGFLFSLGHGLVVTVLSLIIGGGIIEAHVPTWMESLLSGFGTFVSIFFLLVFGVLSLWNVFQNSSASNVPVGIKSFLVRRIKNKKYTPVFVVMVGALFAFSFDTVSQVALFSISASLLSGWVFSGVLGIFFMLGMILSDGLNGWFVSLVIERSDRVSLVLSRSLGLVISTFSLVVGFAALLKIFQ